MRNMAIQRLTIFAVILALGVVVLGAYVRLSDAGLGCPDWPGCYGHLTVTQAEQNTSSVNEAYPERPLETGKAWKEMVHRYFAGILGLIVFAIAFMAWRRRKITTGEIWKLPQFLAVLIVFQALLGMWTVTLLLKPVIVMLHLLGGMATLSLLWWLYMRESDFAMDTSVTSGTRLNTAAMIGLIIVVTQIALGGWTSANYAALACPDFPTCQNEWWPPTDFNEAFVLWRGLGVDYEGGVLDNAARVTIHLVHRIGAVVTFLFIGWLALRALLHNTSSVVRKTGAAMLALLLAQIGLGIANVVMGLPLWVASAHNGVAALLLLSVVTLNHVIRPREWV